MSDEEELVSVFGRSGSKHVMSRFSITRVVFAFMPTTMVTICYELTASYSLKINMAPFWRLPSLYEDLLEKVSYSKVPYRSNRLEPRLKKRDQNIIQY